MTSKSGDQPRHEGGGWEPIETAPKDGTRFLAWVPVPGDVDLGGFHVVASWKERNSRWMSAYDGDELVPLGPTAWQPLPPPPPANPEPPHA